MTKKEFLNALANGKVDVIELFLKTLADRNADYCVIGGLAVNAYAEPVVSLDLDLVVATDSIEAVCEAVAGIFIVERFPHSINLSHAGSDLRIQLQTDPRYQEFIGAAAVMDVLGYSMKVAAALDVLKGKVWAYLDEERRMSKRQKDLADIMRMVETRPELAEALPPEIRDRF